MAKLNVDELISRLPSVHRTQIRTKAAAINAARATARMEDPAAPPALQTLDSSIAKEAPAVQARIIKNGDKLAAWRDASVRGAKPLQPKGKVLKKRSVKQ